MRLARLAGLMYPFGAGSGIPTPPPPSSLLGAIMARFAATPALMAACPGKLLPGIPANSRLIPWAALHQIGGPAPESTSGSAPTDRESTHFQVTIAAPEMADGQAIVDLMKAYFHPKTIRADPLTYETGKAYVARVANERFTPSPEKVKDSVTSGGRLITMAYMVTVDLHVKSVRPWVAPA